MSGRKVDPTAAPVADQTAAPKKKLKQSARATAWQELHRRMNQREQLVIKDAAVAITIWKDERLYGGESKVKGLPRPSEDRDQLIGDPISLQIAVFVEQTEGFQDWRKAIMPGDWFEGLLQERLPYAFLGPWAGLCPADIDELEREEENAKEKDQTEEAKGDTRLLPGMKVV